MGKRLVVTLDGSTRVCGVALLALERTADPGGPGDGRCWRVLGRRSEGDGPGQARSLLPLLDDLLTEVGADPADVGAVVVGTGPGTFTGVRLAVATARALALALDCPVLGVSTLGALVAGVLETFGGTTGAGEPAEPEVVIPFVDARRGEVFYGVYRAVNGSATGGQPHATFKTRATGSTAAISGQSVSGSWATDGEVGAASDRRATGGARLAAWESRGRLYARSTEYGVCDRGVLVALAQAQGRSGLLVGDVSCLVGEPPSGWMAVARGVDPAHLLLGQERLEEPEGVMGGGRAAAWLEEVIWSGGWSLAGGPGCPGAPETVRPIYVRSPDADLHITKMRDPWA